MGLSALPSLEYRVQNRKPLSCSLEVTSPQAGVLQPALRSFVPFGYPVVLFWWVGLGSWGAGIFASFLFLLSF